MNKRLLVELVSEDAHLGRILEAHHPSGTLVHWWYHNGVEWVRESICGWYDTWGSIVMTCLDEGLQLSSVPARSACGRGEGTYQIGDVTAEVAARWVAE